MFACIHSGDPTEAFLNWGKWAILRGNGTWFHLQYIETAIHS